MNLSADKRKVLAESFRVLKPGGRFAISDVIVRGSVPPTIRKNMELWIGCVAGALEEQEFLSLLRELGFEDPSIEPTRVYKAEDAAARGDGADNALSTDIEGGDGAVGLVLNVVVAGVADHSRRADVGVDRGVGRIEIGRASCRERV